MIMLIRNILIVLVIGIPAGLSLGWAFSEAVIWYINYSAGCNSSTPKVVEFQQGMTLCPGQTARGTVAIETK